MKKRLLKILLSILLALLTLGLVVGIIANEPLPEGKSGPQADALAKKMLIALSDSAYQEIEVIRWTYPNGHQYVWNKAQGSVLVKWDDYEVDLNIVTRSGTAKKEGNEVEASKEVLDEAWEYFVNDSFWLVAPFKVFDPGTSRSYIATEAGPGILVTYTSGGVTPGDSYLWVLDEETFLPKYWKMWVKILPIGGLKFTWEDWKTHQGAKFATFHSGVKDIKITGLSVD